MITKETIRNGIKKNVVGFAVDPNMGFGTVCEIGESWFYFGGLAAEEENPGEFLKNSDQNEIIDSIFDVLEDFREDPDFQDEYAYYDAILRENLC